MEPKESECVPPVIAKYEPLPLERRLHHWPFYFFPSLLLSYKFNGSRGKKRERERCQLNNGIVTRDSDDEPPPSP